MGHVSSVAVTPDSGALKAAIKTTQLHGWGCVLLELYLQKGSRLDLACGPLFANPDLNKAGRSGV